MLIYRRVADRVTHIDAGYAHTLLLTEKGDVWTFGCGLFGQMGNGDNKKVGLLWMMVVLWHRFGIINMPFLKGDEAYQSQWLTRPGEAHIGGILPQRGDRRGGERVHVGLQPAGAEAGGAAEEEGAAADHQEGDGKAESAAGGEREFHMLCMSNVKSLVPIFANYHIHSTLGVGEE